MTKKSVKDINLDIPQGDFVKMFITPGNNIVKIVDMTLRPERDPKFGTKLILTLETYPVQTPGFKGLQKVKDKPEMGNYEGQIGYVSYSQYGFKNDITPGGFEVLYKDSLMRALGTLCKSLGKLDWWLEQSYEDSDEGVNEFFKEFITVRPFEGQFFTVCIAGREYLSKDGKHINYELYFPRENRDMGVPFHLKAEKVIKYFETEHLKKIDPKLAIKSTEITPEQPKTQENAIEMIPDQPVRPVHQSQAEKDFMAQSPNNSITSSIDMDVETQRAELSGEIITGDPNEKMPWE